MLIQRTILIILLQCFFLAYSQENTALDYTPYHQQSIQAQTLISEKKYNQALALYEQLFTQYDFIFLKEYQIATQLALHLNQPQKAYKYLQEGILAGWSLKSIKKNKFLNQLWTIYPWKDIKIQYKPLREAYEASLDQVLVERVREMFRKDQQKAFGALFTFSSDAQDRYAERKFAPHSEKQMSVLLDILSNDGYPGEKLVGNTFWMSTILSHHNSISRAYNRQDTLYLHIKPKLEEALKHGQISPFEMALIDEWYGSTVDMEDNTPYGIITQFDKSDLSKVNTQRAKVFLNSIDVRDKLIQLSRETGMNFYSKEDAWLFMQ